MMTTIKVRFVKFAVSQRARAKPHKEVVLGHNAIQN